jgi:dihydrofolate reductase
MIISIIVAATQNLVIGHDNKLIWSLPLDMKHFKNTTMGHHIIMGRKTYESMGRPLPGRTNVIITHNKDYKAEGCVVVYSIEEAISFAQKNGETEACIIGGAEIFNKTVKLVDKIYYTEVKTDLEGNIKLKPIDFTGYELIKEELFPNDDKHLYPFVIKEYVRKT